MTELELLAPARNLDIGIAAIDCGADAVYIAAEQFGARQAAGNSIEDIEKLCNYAKKFGVRIFVTLNTILYEDELERVYTAILKLQEAGVSALIVQDMAIIEMARKSKEITLPIHASTQCSIRDVQRAKELEDLGFSRIILERELSLEQIKAIRSEVSCEIEFFVHGALCVCYSGQCYLSEMLAERSANRGACVQACRSRYDLLDENGNTIVKNKALLSLKDYQLLDRIEDLAEAGVSSFKIEGRLKNESYVRNVVREYSIAIDKLIKTHPDKYCRASFGKVVKSFTPDTNKTFNRGYTELFLDGKRGKWAAMDAAKGMGEEIGKVLRTDKSKSTIELSFNKGKGFTLNNGDGFSFVARNGEVIGFRGDICQGNQIKTKPVAEIYSGVTIFRNLDSAFEKEIDRNKGAREIPVSLNIKSEFDGLNYTLHIEATSQDGRIIKITHPAGEQAANNIERMREIMRTQLSKTADIYSFEVAEIQDENGLPFMAAAALNAIRRDIAQQLSEMPLIPRPLENRTSTLPKKAELTRSSVSYKDNVANSLARKIYCEGGVTEIEQAYELSHRPNAELMRTKYCIRHELGICLKDRPKYTGRLYLLNNFRKFELGFDCKNCEMTVTQA